MIIGHKKQWQLLKKSKEMGKLSHAYLFSGEEKLGKKTLAIEFAKFLNCLDSGKIKPCNNCKNCLNIEKGIYPDFVIIEPVFLQNEKNKNKKNSLNSSKSIGIKQIKDLILKLSLRSFSSLYKIAIIDDAHLMTYEAQNCFLKFLEEPKGDVVLILITSYPEMLLPTILSRVEKINFFPVEKEEIEKYIFSKKQFNNTEEIFLIAKGKPGTVIDFLNSPDDYSNYKKTISELENIINSDISFRFNYLRKLIEENSNFLLKISEILNIWLNYFRYELLLRLNIKEKENNKILQKYSLSKIIKIINLIQSTNFLISTTNVNPKLAIELLLIEI